MLELSSPAGSYEAVIAAVQSGADSVYFGFDFHNAKRTAPGFTDEELENALRYCRTRGCGAYVAINTLISDGEMKTAAGLAQRASELGADAIIIQDVGFGRVLRGLLPDIKLHASARMSIHNLAGAEAAAEMGISRVTLARELSLEQISYIGQRTPVELEIFVHGDLCICYSGQCYMSALTGEGSNSRGLCSEPCRRQYSMGGRNDDYPLSLRDSCLVDHLDAIERAGIRCVKIDGRLRREEYTAVATRLYANAMKNKKRPTDAELYELRDIFSENGFTDGYLTGRLDEDMFGVRDAERRISMRLLSDIRRTYQQAETRRVPVNIYAVVRAGEAVRLAADDAQGTHVVVEGAPPRAAGAEETTERSLSESLYKTGGTPFQMNDIKCLTEPGLYVPDLDVQDMRRRLLQRLLEKRSKPPRRRVGSIPPLDLPRETIGSPVLNIQISDREQLTPALAEMGAHILYVPLTVLAEDFELVKPFSEVGTKIVGVMPRVLSGVESTDVRGLLKRARLNGVEEVLIGNMGHIRHGVLEGFGIRGDFGLNVFNSWSAQVMRDAGFLSATASFELKLSQLRELNKPLPIELMAYGRMPVMVTRRCIIEHSFGSCNCGGKHHLSDKRGSLFPVMRDFQCQNVIYNSKKLFLADRSADYSNIGLWGIRLLFTTESSRECVMVARAYKGETKYVPNGFTRGCYYKGVE